MKRRRKNTGVTEARMKSKLAPLIAACVLGEPTAEEIQQIEASMKLYGAVGYWRHSKADVMQFTGQATVNGMPYEVGSWDSMSDCLRYGFEFLDNRGDRLSYATFECHSHGRRNER